MSNSKMKTTRDLRQCLMELNNLLIMNVNILASVNFPNLCGIFWIWCKLASCFFRGVIIARVRNNKM